MLVRPKTNQQESEWEQKIKGVQKTMRHSDIMNFSMFFCCEVLRIMIIFKSWRKIIWGFFKLSVSYFHFLLLRYSISSSTFFVHSILIWYRSFYSISYCFPFAAPAALIKTPRRIFLDASSTVSLWHCDTTIKVMVIGSWCEKQKNFKSMNKSLKCTSK